MTPRSRQGFNCGRSYPADSTGLPFRRSGRTCITPAMRLDPQTVLRSVFGYDSFRGMQRDVIDHMVEGGDALVIMPTGGGKSLCYQIPALVRPGVAVVVSPLIALMQDQVEALRQLGVRAAALNSTLPWPEQQDVERQMRAVSWISSTWRRNG